MRNVGDKALRLYDMGHDSSWRVIFAPRGSGIRRRAGRFNIWARESRAPSYLGLRKGAEEVAVRRTFAGAHWLFADAEATGYEAIWRTLVNTLPSGIYTVTASYENREERPWSKGCWIGKVTTGVAEIQITAKSTAGAAPAKEDTERASVSFLEKGLSVTAKPAKKVFGPKEPLAFDVTFRNVSKKPFMLFDVDFYYWWRYTFTEIKRTESGQEWEARCLLKFKRGAPAATMMRPGSSHGVRAILRKGFYYGRDLEKRLPVEKYAVSVTVRLSKPQDMHIRKLEASFWTGTIKTEPVEFEIAKGGAP